MGFASALAVGRAVRTLPDALAAAEEDLAAAGAAVAGIWGADQPWPFGGVYP
jgi:hypothetical protein